MNTATRYSLSADERLKSRKQIDQLFLSGKSFNTFPIRVQWNLQTEETASLKAGFGVSNRHFKKAVDRNRIKRLLRENYRLQKHLLQQLVEEKQLTANVFFLFQHREMPTFELVQKKMQQSLDRLVKIIHETAQVHP